MKVVLASNNKGKIREFSAYLSPFEIELYSQAEFHLPSIQETGLTFVENAIIKARHTCAFTKLPSIADDSGLTCSALYGDPGIYSARFAGENATDLENIQKLLYELRDVPYDKRQASFHCALVFLRHEKDPSPIICQGEWNGIIMNEPQGEQGFGYDPVFYIPSLKKRAAELPLTLKNKISHRGQALQALVKILSETKILFKS